MKQSSIDKFWGFVNKPEESDKCWEYQYSLDHYGYGRFCYESQRILAHRFSWILHNGPIPDGLHVLHTCDNPPCVRPDHLFLGTQRDNNLDSAAKGRRCVGEDHPLSKLTEIQVAEIRRRHGLGEPTLQIANDLGIYYQTVIHIVNGATWKHVDGPISKENRCKILTDDQIIEIRKRYDNGEIQRRIAADYGIDRTTVSLIGLRRHWKHIGE